MPSRAPTACNRPGCTRTTPCPDHPARWAHGAPGRPMPPGWAATRRRILTRDPACTLAYPGCTGTSTEVDHVHGPGTEDDQALRGVCTSCHRKRTQQQATEARRLT